MAHPQPTVKLKTDADNKGQFYNLSPNDATRVALSPQKERARIILNQEEITKQQAILNTKLKEMMDESSALIKAQKDFIHRQTAALHDREQMLLRKQREEMIREYEHNVQKWTGLLAGGFTSIVLIGVTTIAAITQEMNGANSIALVTSTAASGIAIGSAAGTLFYKKINRVKWIHSLVNYCTGNKNTKFFDGAKDNQDVVISLPLNTTTKYAVNEASAFPTPLPILGQNLETNNVLAVPRAPNAYSLTVDLSKIRLGIDSQTNPGTNFAQIDKKGAQEVVLTVSPAAAAASSQPIVKNRESSNKASSSSVSAAGKTLSVPFSIQGKPVDRTPSPRVASPTKKGPKK